MNRQERFRACDCTPYACCGISFFTTTVNTLHFSGPIKSSKTIYIRFLKNYGYSHIMYPIRLSSRMLDMNGIKGDLSIREASCRRDVSKRKVDPYCAERRISGASRSGRSWAIPEDAKKPYDPCKADTNKMSRR